MIVTLGVKDYLLKEKGQSERKDRDELDKSLTLIPISLIRSTD